MQNDKPEPFNAGAETESGLTPEQEARDEELLTSLGKFLENAGALRVTLYAAQRADQRVTTGTPLVTLIIPADEVDTAFVLGSDTKSQSRDLPDGRAAGDAVAPDRGRRSA